MLSEGYHYSGSSAEHTRSGYSVEDCPYQKDSLAQSTLLCASEGIPTSPPSGSLKGECLGLRASADKRPSLSLFNQRILRRPYRHHFNYSQVWFLRALSELGERGVGAPRLSYGGSHRGMEKTALHSLFISINLPFLSFFAMSLPWSSYYSKYFLQGWGYEDWSYRWFIEMEK